MARGVCIGNLRRHKASESAKYSKRMENEGKAIWRRGSGGGSGGAKKAAESEIGGGRSSKMETESTMSGSRGWKKTAESAI